VVWRIAEEVFADAMVTTVNGQGDPGAEPLKTRPGSAVLPGRSPMRLEAVESNHTMRKLLSPFALHYFVVAQKKAAG